MKWEDEIRAAFAGRADLALDLLAIEFSRDPVELAGCLEVFELEYGVSMGTLRPGDSLEVFTREPETTVLTWLFVRGGYEDKLSELETHIACVRADRGLSRFEGTVRSVADYVSACLDHQGP